MRISEVVIEGVLKPDGTLELAQTPNLLPGRVQVIIRQETESPAPVAENWFQCLLRLRANREADGYPFMNEAAVTAHLAWLREGDRIDDLLEELPPLPTQPEKP